MGFLLSYGARAQLFEGSNANATSAPRPSLVCKIGNPSRGRQGKTLAARRSVLAGRLHRVNAPGVGPGRMGALAVNMKNRGIVGLLTMLCLLLGAAPRAGAQVGASPSGLAVSGVRTDGSSVTGWVENQTSHEVRDVRLMVEQEFRWTREMRPGDDNPGSGTIVRVPQPIPPGGKVQFRYDMPAPLPQRNDGHFETEVKVLSFSEHWFTDPTAAR
jgi:hypothetical protein